MIFSILITIVFVFMAAYVISLWSHTWWGRLLLLAYLVAIVLVWMPDVAIATANYVGVQSGVNLIFMVMILVLLNGMILMGRQLYITNRKFTLLARHVALSKSEAPTRVESMPDIDVQAANDSQHQ